MAASVANSRPGTGLAWIGHDLWGASSQTPFVIPKADTTCLAGTNPACSTANGTVIQALTSVVGATALAGDQFYPATNGDNLYFAAGSNIAWVGNVAGGAAGQTITLTYINAAQAQLANAGAVALDATDPANLVLYCGDDPGGLGTVGAGRWFQTIQTSAAPAPPGTPLDVQASGGESQVTVSWSPAQVAQPVTSYTVHNSVASNGLPINDVVITPRGGLLYPQTAATITGLSNNVTYQFSVLASNAQGSSAFSSPSNSVQLVSVPTAPTGVQAVAGDGQVSVTWTAPANTGGLPLLSNTITALANGVASSTTAVSASATSAQVSGLTNGVTYSFTVHATNSVGDSPESAPSNAVTPQTAVVSIAVSGPYSFVNTPAIASYKVTVTNISPSAVSNVSVNNLLSTIDGAYIIAAQPAQGTCAQGGVGITNVSCSLGSMAPSAVVAVDVVTQMQGGQITLSSGASGTDGQGSAFTVAPQQRTTIHGNPPAGTPVVSISLSVNAIPTDLGPGKPGTINWNLQNTTGIAARNLVLAMVIDSRMNITSAAVTGSNSTDPVSCNAPSPGVGGTSVLTCNIASLGGPSSSTTVTAMKVTVNYTAPVLTPLTLPATGYLSFDGSDSSAPVAATSIRVK
ncbi:MAG: fibronectin type III domain-containing protein [Candidatus Angelobacter sp.]